MRWKPPQISNDKRIIEQFSNPKIQALEENINGVVYLRLIRPLIADESCVACHEMLMQEVWLGVMDISHSLEGV